MPVKIVWKYIVSLNKLQDIFQRCINLLLMNKDNFKLVGRLFSKLKFHTKFFTKAVDKQQTKGGSNKDFQDASVGKSRDNLI